MSRNYLGFKLLGPISCGPRIWKLPLPPLSHARCPEQRSRSQPFHLLWSFKDRPRGRGRGRGGGGVELTSSYCIYMIAQWHRAGGLGSWPWFALDFHAQAAPEPAGQFTWEAQREIRPAGQRWSWGADPLGWLSGRHVAAGLPEPPRRGSKCLACPECLASPTAVTTDSRVRAFMRLRRLCKGCGVRPLRRAFQRRDEVGDGRSRRCPL